MSLVHYLYSASWFLPVRILLSFIYLFIITARNYFYERGIFKTYSVSVPVISVGNISVGGSGKTILVQTLIQYFLDQNKLPSVLSRGYGRHSKDLLLVADKTSRKANVLTAGDEPFLIAENFPGVPVVVSGDRVKGARYLSDIFTPDVIILDDGFQHRRLHRRLNLLLIDDPDIQTARLLPWGKYREPPIEKKRADLILYTKAGLQSNSDNNLEFILDDHVFDYAGTSYNLTDLYGNYGLFAGLGNPAFFFQSLQQQHQAAQTLISFSDHTAYTSSQLDKISRVSVQYWITTQKDFIKLNLDFCRKHRIHYIKVSSTLPRALIQQLKHYFK